jgi:putative (di)nucleoside polyphosphate hydrolase
VSQAATPADVARYRPNVGIVLFHPAGNRVWLGRRAGTPDPYNWQFPQGGVDDGEDLLDAARRELEEETGVSDTTLLGRTEDWITYDFPADHRGSKQARGWSGQRQMWFALRMSGPQSQIRLDLHAPVEFDAWRWASLEETPALVVPFKRSTYDQVVAAFAPFAAGLG